MKLEKLTQLKYFQPQTNKATVLYERTRFTKYG